MVDLNLVLYKFFPSKAKDYFFTEGTIQFSTVSQLNDPFEGLFMRDREKVEQIVDKNLAESWEDLVSMTGSEELASKREQFFRAVQNAGAANSYQAIARRLGIFSASRKCNHPLMWSHYGESLRGICIGFDESHPAFKCAGIDWIGLNGFYQVIYSSSRSHLSATYLQARTMNPFLLKGITWEYEEEWRLFSEIDLEDVGGRKLMQFPRDALKEVIVGAGMSRQTADHIWDLLRNEWPTVRIFTSSPAIDRFELEVNEIPFELGFNGTLIESKDICVEDIKEKYSLQRSRELAELMRAQQRQTNGWS